MKPNMNAHLLILTLLLFGCSKPQSNEHPRLNYTQLYKLLEKQVNESWHDQYVDEFIIKHNESWPDLSIKCWPEMTGAGLKGFHLIIVVNSFGNVEYTRTDNSDYSAQCFNKGIEKISYPVPPEKYAYVILGVGDVGIDEN